jgi:hypothetical protein
VVVRCEAPLFWNAVSLNPGGRRSFGVVDVLEVQIRVRSSLEWLVELAVRGLKGQ